MGARDVCSIGRAAQEEVSMTAAGSNRGLMRFMLYEGALNVERFLAFLRWLVKDTGQKVSLIVDNFRIHHARKVGAWVERHAHDIKLFYLLAYERDHIPDEYLDNKLNQRLRQQPQPDDRDELVRNARAALRAIQRPPERTHSYFTPKLSALPSNVSGVALGD
jgi:hypothetical protein